MKFNRALLIGLLVAFLVISVALWPIAWSLGLRGGSSEVVWNFGAQFWPETDDWVFNLAGRIVIVLLLAPFYLGGILVMAAGVCVLAPLAVLSLIAQAGPFGFLVAIAIGAAVVWHLFKKYQRKRA